MTDKPRKYIVTGLAKPQDWTDHTSQTNDYSPNSQRLFSSGAQLEESIDTSQEMVQGARIEGCL